MFAVILNSLMNEIVLLHWGINASIMSDETFNGSEASADGL
jgi:hypothetical protein